MSNRWTSKNLHEELALYYRQFAGVPAPKNSFTEDLWAKIMLTEAQEAATRAKS